MGHNERITGSLLLFASIFVSCDNAKYASGETGAVRQAPPATTVASELKELDPTKDASTWAEVTTAFREELTPDPSTNDPAQRAYRIKQIAKTWRFGDAFLVVVEKRSGNKDDEEWNRLFELFNYNRKTSQKSAIKAKWPFWLWKFDQLADFEKGPVADIVFESFSCTECEPEEILSSLRFNRDKGNWELRLWPQGEQGLGVGDAAAGMDVGDATPEYGMLSGIGDFRRTGCDEVAIWMHYQSEDGKHPGKLLPPVTEVRVYGYRNGIPEETQLKRTEEIARIKALLCRMNPEADACKPGG